MKKNVVLFILLLMVCISCSDWSNYYSTKKNGVAYDSLSMTVEQYLKTHSEYSTYYNLLQSSGLATNYLEKNQYVTVWAVNNSNIASAGVTAQDTSTLKYNMNYLSYTASNLTNGLRIQMLNGVYAQVNILNNQTYMQNSMVTKSVKLTNGVVNEISNLMIPQKNMYDFIQSLGNDYSMFRDSIMRYSVKKFNQSSSIPIGVDKTGNTVYDSIFYVYNPVFDTVRINSSATNFTVFVPSNKVINNCYTNLYNLRVGQGQTMTKSDTLLAFGWIKRAAFYNGALTSFSGDLTSPFTNSKTKYVWRTTVQQIDQSNPVTLSNGYAYYTTFVRVPNNFLITRIKSLVEYYEYLTADEQAQYYQTVGATTIKAYDSGTATPIASYGSPKTYVYLDVAQSPIVSTGEFSVKFYPITTYTDASGVVHGKVMQVPPGEYVLSMGFDSNLATSKAEHPYVDVYFNDVLIGTKLAVEASSPWNFDRVNNCTATYLGHTVSKWDGDGGAVGTVTIPGTQLTSFTIKVAFNSFYSTYTTKKELHVYHWALRPTSNNY